MNLDTLRIANIECTDCGLRKGCRQVVPILGNKIGSILLVGEAPGADEDIMGEPFVGRSGQFLDKLLEQNGMTRKDICISNTVKCRPPGNRVPTDAEIQACKKWLWRDIQTAQPILICTLGITATRLLLKLPKQVKMGDYIGKIQTVDYMATPILPCYHPSYYLRRPSKMVEDQFKDVFKQIKERLTCQQTTVSV